MKFDLYVYYFISKTQKLTLYRDYDIEYTNNA